MATIKFRVDMSKFLLDQRLEGSIQAFVTDWFKVRGMEVEILPPPNRGAGFSDWLTWLIDFFHKLAFLKLFTPFLRPLATFLKERQRRRRDMKWRLTLPGASLILVCEANGNEAPVDGGLARNFLFVSKALLKDAGLYFSFLRFNGYIVLTHADSRRESLSIDVDGGWLSHTKNALLLHKIIQKLPSKELGVPISNITIKPDGKIFRRSHYIKHNNDEAQLRYYWRLLGLFIRIPAKLYHKMA